MNILILRLAMNFAWTSTQTIRLILAISVGYFVNQWTTILAIALGYGFYRAILTLMIESQLDNEIIQMKADIVHESLRLPLMTKTRRIIMLTWTSALFVFFVGSIVFLIKYYVTKN